MRISGCLATWLATPVQGKPSAGAGVRASLLSSINLRGGNKEVTYAGHPLYIYGAAPALTSYVGTREFGGNWYAINAKGHAVKRGDGTSGGGTTPLPAAAYATQWAALSRTWQEAAQSYNSAVNAPGVNNTVVATASGAFSQATAAYAIALSMLTPPTNAANAQAALVSAIRAMAAGINQLQTAAQNNAAAAAANAAKRAVAAAGKQTTSAARALGMALAGG